MLLIWILLFRQLKGLKLIKQKKHIFYGENETRELRPFEVQTEKSILLKIECLFKEQKNKKK